MLPIFPIIFSWCLFVISLIHLLVHLVLLHFLNEKFFLVASIILFVCAAVSFWKTFTMMSKKIMNGMSNWDDEMKKDIVQFLGVRKVRLISSGFFMAIVFILHVALRSMQVNKEWNYIGEGVFYLYLIGLFHISLVSTLIYLKLIRTLSWISVENRMADMEQH